MDTRSNTWSRLCVVLGVMFVIIAYHTEAAPTQESDSSRLANALLRLDDALDNLSAYFKDTRKEELENADANTNDEDQNTPNIEEPVVNEDAQRAEQTEADSEEEDINDEPKPETSEKEERNEDAEIMNNQDGSRPEFTAELDEMAEKELAEVPDGEQAMVDEDDEDRQEAVLRAALRYLLKVQKQERRQKKDYDIPFPIFGYKRGPENE